MVNPPTQHEQECLPRLDLGQDRILTHRMVYSTWVNLGLHTVPSDGYGCTLDGQVTGTVQLSAVRQVWSADP